MKVERDAELGCSPEALYKVLMDPSRLGEWVSIHEKVEDAPGQLRQGSTMTQRMKVAGQRFTVRWKVTEADRPSHVVWEGTGPAGTYARVVYDLEKVDGGTSFTYLNEYELPGGAAGKFAARAVSSVAGKEVERSIERLREIVES